MNWQPLVLTFKLSLITSILLLVVCLPLAYFIANKKFRFRSILESIISLPLVLPPTVLGFYLLICMSPKSHIGGFFLKYFDYEMVFSFSGLVLGSMIYSLPFMMHPLIAGFDNIPKSYYKLSSLLGKSNIEIWRHIRLPLMLGPMFTGFVLSLAHTIGEFGVVLMIGGSIPGKTKVASIAIFEQVEALKFHQAHKYSLVLVLISFCILLVLFYNRQDHHRILGDHH